MTAEESLEQAEAIVAKIDDKSKRLMLLERELYQANRTLDQTKHALMIEVSAELQEDGKKKFANADARKAEVEHRSKAHGQPVAELIAEKEEVEYDLKQAERHLKFHYKVVDWDVSRNLSLMPSITDIQEFLFDTIKRGVADLLMAKPEPYPQTKGGSE